MTMCKCSTCGYEWKHGMNGSHSCTETMQQTINTLRAAASVVIARHDSGEMTYEPHESDSIEALRALVPSDVKVVP